MAGSPPNFHKMVSRWTCMQGVIKVKVKGHVIRALLCWHENRFFSQANGRIATKLAHDSLRVSVHSRACSRSRSKVTWYAHFLGFFEWATPSLTVWLGYSNELMQCCSVRLSVNFLRKLLLLAGKWLDRNQTFTRWSPGKPASRVCSRSRSRFKVT